MGIISFLENIWLLKKHPVTSVKISESFWLALGGGAARGLAHLGVLQYLEEHWLSPIEISGTSMGSIIAALYSIGKTPSDIKELVKNTKFTSLIDPDLKTGLIKGQKIQQYLEKILNGATFKDCHIPLKIVATDIDTGKKRVFSEGSLIDAIRASIWVPWAFRPHEFEWCHYVDGGLTENVPISVLEAHDIIGVSVLRDISRPHTVTKNVLGFEFNLNFATGYRIMQKSIDILLSQNEAQSFSIAGKHILKIQPHFPEIDYYEFHRYEEIISAGYVAAKSALEKGE